MMNDNETWTKEMEHDLLFLAKFKNTRREIADLINEIHGTKLTKNAVIGKLNKIKGKHHERKSA